MKPAAYRRLQRAAGIALGLLLVGLLANSVFLVAAATPTGLVIPMQRLHLALGLGLCVVLPAFVASHVRLHRRHRNESARTVGYGVAALAVLGCLAGAALWWVGKSREVGWVVTLHEGAFIVALLAYGLHRLRARATPALRGEVLAAVAAVAIGAGIWATQQWWPTERSTDTAAERPTLDAGLSQARTTDGHVLAPEDLDNPDYCAQCHPAIAERWDASAHHFGSLNDPFYAATLATAQGHRSPQQLGFCGGCHDPLLLLTGRMATHPTPDSPGANAGITCLACHAITEVPDRLGNGSYTIAAPQHYPGYDSDDADEREASRRLIRSKPAQHIESFSPKHLRDPQLCAGCHKAHIPPELNDHRWLRGQNEWDAWHDSGAGGYSARTFYAPGEQKRCQDCHMPRVEADDPAAKDGTVADHAFLGANTALGTALQKPGWVQRNQEFLRGVVSIDVGAIEVPRPDAPRGVLRRLAPPLDGSPVALDAGAPVTVDLVIRNRKSGHLYPGGIADLRQAWLEVTLLDADGTPQLASGWLDPTATLDPGAHRWNAVLLDKEGKPLVVHDVEDAQVVLTARRIMLGASDIVRVAFTGPAEPSRLRIRVLDRKFPADYVTFALGEDAPPMPITAVAEASIAFVPGPLEAVEPSADAGPRLRDLGIGHLLRGDTALAEQAATAAATRLPDDPGPPLDLARGALDDGMLELAERYVRQADALAPGHATAAWLLARIRSGQGNHEAAVAALDTALAQFPRDRQLLVLKGEALFRLEREAEAAEVLQAALEIDPELLGAHALLTRITASQGDAERSAFHQQQWDRLRPHSADRVIAEKARRSDPALDRRANRQYVLPLSVPADGWHPAAAD